MEVKTEKFILESKTNRGKEWAKFAQEILDHIENYTVPQYGDDPDDLCAKKDATYCKEQISKYEKRFDTNARPNQDRLDLCKIAHYCCIAVAKIDESDETKNHICQCCGKVLED